MVGLAVPTMINNRRFVDVHPQQDRGSPLGVGQQQHQDLPHLRQGQRVHHQAWAQAQRHCLRARLELLRYTTPSTTESQRP